MAEFDASSRLSRACGWQPDVSVGTDPLRQVEVVGARPRYSYFGATLPKRDVIIERDPDAVGGGIDV